MGRNEHSPQSAMLQSALDRLLQSEERSRQAESLARDAKHEHVLARLEALEESVADVAEKLSDRLDAALLALRSAEADHARENAVATAAIAASVDALVQTFSTPPKHSDPTLMTVEDMIQAAKGDKTQRARLHAVLQQVEFDDDQLVPEI